jgi:hypothetical protein
VTETPPERPGPPAVGPLAVEAALLLDVVADRLVAMKRTTESAARTSATPDQGGLPPDQGGLSPDQDGAEGRSGPSAAPNPDPHPQAVPSSDPGSGLGSGGRCPECGSVPGASCTACPLCRFMSLLRGERPEATAKLVDGALMIVRTLRSLVPDPPETTPGTAATGATGTGATETSGGNSGGASTRHGEATPHQSPRRGGLEHIDIS